jgi:hypothetical protein
MVPTNQLLNGSFKVFPNPVNQILTIDSPTNEAANLLIYDNVGKLILTKELGEAQKQVDVSFLKTGFYILKWVTKNETSTASFIKK